MIKNRRIWLKQLGLGIVGLGIGQLKIFASPAPDYSNSYPSDIPLRLDLNENPYGPSPLAQIAMAENIQISNRYNWGHTPVLISAIAKKNNVNINNILLGGQD